ncbi:MAG: SMC-Scp complex subunit ScpB [Candidatus Brennerbacteria bacterium]|nr:SMC-Scp complex subunit ScpB [Candidatus Brennerbacteria bacterium]
MKNLEAACEAVLFHYGAPLAIEKLAKILDVTPEECRASVTALGAQLTAAPDRGLVLLANGDEVALATKPAFKKFLALLMKEEFHESLTPAALETLSLVAYLGPVARTSIDYIRGVNSSFTLRNLLLRGLVERTARVEGGGYVYTASIEFLKHMGLQKVEDLPEYEKHRAHYRDFELAAREEVKSDAVPLP